MASPSPEPSSTVGPSPPTHLRLPVSAKVQCLHLGRHRQRTLGGPARATLPRRLFPKAGVYLYITPSLLVVGENRTLHDVCILRGLRLTWRPAPARRAVAAPQACPPQVTPGGVTIRTSLPRYRHRSPASLHQPQRLPSGCGMGWVSPLPRNTAQTAPNGVEPNQPPPDFSIVRIVTVLARVAPDVSVGDRGIARRLAIRNGVKETQPLSSVPSVRQLHLRNSNSLKNNNAHRRTSGPAFLESLLCKAIRLGLSSPEDGPRWSQAPTCKLPFRLSRAILDPVDGRSG